jgi:uncharacterized phage protein (TIGR02220 family)
VLVTKSTSHQLIWLKILADGESVPLSILAKIGGVSKTQAFNIVQWGKEYEVESSPKILQKTGKNKKAIVVNADKPLDDKENLIRQKVDEIISYLNLATGKKFSSTGADNTKYVVKLLKENYSIDDFKHVIDVKTSKWKGTDMDDYLRPQTLFGNKFNAYLNESINHGTKQTSSSIQQTIDTAQRVAESFDWGLDSE